MANRTPELDAVHFPLSPFPIQRPSRMVERILTAHQTHMPLSVAVIGAGPERRKFGNKSVRAHLAAGYTVYPVHPTAETVEGLQAYRSVADVPVEKLDRVTVYLPPTVGL